MKKLGLAVCALSVLLSACNSSKIMSYSDDVYANPSEEKRLAAVAAVEKAKKEAEEKQKVEDARLAQKAKDDANPYYKDPEYSQDDYYDYEYASRVRRFHQPVSGTGYYDNWYTNSYWYNNNPSFYGNSIYANPTWAMMPSAQFGYYNNGWGMGYGNGWGTTWNNGWNNSYYGYNNGWNNGWNSPWNCPSSAYWMGYNQGYNNGWYGQPYGWGNSWNNGGWGNGWNNGGWGYYNSFDVNSGYSHVGPRGSMTGGNNARSSYGGMSYSEAQSSSRAYFESVVAAQANTPKFEETARPRKVRETNTTTSVPSSQETANPKVNTGTSRGSETNSNANTNNGGGLWNWTKNRVEQGNNESTSAPSNTNNSSNSNSGTPTRRRVESGKINETPMGNNNNSSTERSNSGGSNGGGSSSPRSGSSGSSRPR
jgi:hypothetical protein